MKTMARYLLLMLLILLQSCTANSPVDENPAVAPQAISFATYTPQPVATRANTAYLAEQGIPGGKSIGIYCYYHNNSTWSSAATPNFMFNQEAVHVSTNNFGYSPLKYWPNENSDKLSFIAYYPYVSSGTANGLTPLLTNTDTGLPTFRFEVNNDASQQIDFLVSALIPDLPESRDTDPDPGLSFDNLRIRDRVHFVFYHMTSKIEFRIVVDNAIKDNLAYYTLNGISISNIYNEGLLTPSYDPSTDPTTTFTWSDYSTDHKYTYNCKTDEAYLLLPQTIRSDAALTVNYDLAFKSEGTSYTYDGSGNLVPTDTYVYRNRTSSVLLKDLVTVWKPHHHYVYIIKLGAHRIGFTGQVVDWGETVDYDPLDEETNWVNIDVNQISN